MKVYDRNLSGASAAEAGRTQEAQQPNRSEQARAGSSRTGSEDRVELSGTLTRLSQALSAFGTSRASRVQALAAQYQSGNYSPDSLATSQGMVSEALSAGLK